MKAFKIYANETNFCPQNSILLSWSDLDLDLLTENQLVSVLPHKPGTVLSLVKFFSDVQKLSYGNKFRKNRRIDAKLNSILPHFYERLGTKKKQNRLKKV